MSVSGSDTPTQLGGQATVQWVTQVARTVGSVVSISSGVWRSVGQEES